MLCWLLYNNYKNILVNVLHLNFRKNKIYSTHSCLFSFNKTKILINYLLTINKDHGWKVINIIQLPAKQIWYGANVGQSTSQCIILELDSSQSSIFFKLTLWRAYFQHSSNHSEIETYHSPGKNPPPVDNSLRPWSWCARKGLPDCAWGYLVDHLSSLH